MNNNNKKQRQNKKQTLNYREQTDGYRGEVSGRMGETVKGIKSTLILVRLGGSVLKHLPLAQGVIPGFWDRATHQAPLLGACFFLSHSPCMCSLSRWLSLSNE